MRLILSITLRCIRSKNKCRNNSQDNNQQAGEYNSGVAHLASMYKALLQIIVMIITRAVNTLHMQSLTTSLFLQYWSWTQGLAHVRQGLYHSPTSPDMWYFLKKAQIGSPNYILPKLVGKLLCLLVKFAYQLWEDWGTGILDWQEKASVYLIIVPDVSHSS